MTLINNRTILPYLIILNILAGWLLYLSFSPHNWYLLTFLSIAIFYFSLRCNTVSSSNINSAGIGLIFGISYYFSLLRWAGDFVGIIASFSLAITCAIQIVLVALLTRCVQGIFSPIWFSLVWVVTEIGITFFPFGGFSWGRVAYTQINSCVSNISPILGVNGVSFITILVASLTAEIFFVTYTKTCFYLLGLTILLISLGTVYNYHLDKNSRHLPLFSVALVQGGVPEPGFNSPKQSEMVLDNHIQQTYKLFDYVSKANIQKPEIVFWPENSLDVDPLQSSVSGEKIANLVDTIDSPLAFGTISHHDKKYFNSYELWIPKKYLIAQYDKQHIQPFGEYMPFRSFFKKFSSYVDKAGNFSKGNHAGIFTVNNRQFGVVICFETIFENLLNSTVSQGAEWLVVPSNNATFRSKDMAYQQLGIDRFWAKQYKMSVLVPTTNGVSAIIESNGNLKTTIDKGESGFLIGKVNIQNHKVPIVFLEKYIIYFSLLVFLVGICYGYLRNRKKINGKFSERISGYSTNL